MSVINNGILFVANALRLSNEMKNNKKLIKIIAIQRTM